MAKKAVFLDRDGTLNDDPGYLSDPEHLKLFDGVPEALARLRAAGFLLVVVSNQSGVGRGLIPAENIPLINERLNLLLEPSGARIHHFELCFHHPKDECECRKPKPKLITDAAAKLGVDLSRSYMIGDKVSDVDAGWRARCAASILVRTGDGPHSEKMLRSEDRAADFTADSLRAAADWILARETSGS